MFQAEAAELSQLVADKLEFLDVSRSGLSKLQVLLIEMQVLITLSHSTTLYKQFMYYCVHYLMGV